MKIFFLFLLISVLSGCLGSKITNSSEKYVDCPSVLFSSEHKSYIDSSAQETTLNNVNFTAKLNNAKFTKNCFIKNNKFYGKLSILFIINRLQESEINLKLPYFIARIDDEGNLKDVQYYLLTDKLQKYNEFNNITEKDLRDTKEIIYYLDRGPNEIVIGFMLNDKKINILN